MKDLFTIHKENGQLDNGKIILWMIAIAFIVFFVLPAPAKDIYFYSPGMYP